MTSSLTLLETVHGCLQSTDCRLQSSYHALKLADGGVDLACSDGVKIAVSVAADWISFAPEAVHQLPQVCAADAQNPFQLGAADAVLSAGAGTLEVCKQLFFTHFLSFPEPGFPKKGIKKEGAVSPFGKRPLNLIFKFAMADGDMLFHLHAHSLRLGWILHIGIADKNAGMLVFVTATQRIQIHVFIQFLRYGGFMGKEVSAQ